MSQLHRKLRQPKHDRESLFSAPVGDVAEDADLDGDLAMMMTTTTTTTTQSRQESGKRTAALLAERKAAVRSAA